MKLEPLAQAGIDYEAGLRRFMNDKAMYQAVLGAFLRDDVIARVREAYASGDRERLKAAVHEAKGSSGNGGFTAVYDQASALMTLLRGESYTDDELTAAYQRFVDTYMRAWNGIKAALEA